MVVLLWKKVNTALVVSVAKLLSCIKKKKRERLLLRKVMSSRLLPRRYLRTLTGVATSARRKQWSTVQTFLFSPGAHFKLVALRWFFFFFLIQKKCECGAGDEFELTFSRLWTPPAGIVIQVRSLLVFAPENSSPAHKAKVKKRKNPTKTEGRKNYYDMVFFLFLSRLKSTFYFWVPQS